MAKLITTDTGKLISEAEGEVELSAGIFDYYGEHGRKFLVNEILDSGKEEAHIKSYPMGVLLGIIPCTFPLYHLARFVAPNIMAENATLIKHASNMTETAIAIQELFNEAEAPEGLYTNLKINSRHASSLLADSRIMGVSLNADEEIASTIAMEARMNLKKVVVEVDRNDAISPVFGGELSELRIQQFTS